MPGDDGSSLPICAYYMAICGGIWQKLLFMGCEFGQKREWQHDESLEWGVLHIRCTQGCRRWVEDLNRFTAVNGAYQQDFSR